VRNGELRALMLDETPLLDAAPLPDAAEREG